MTPSRCSRWMIIGLVAWPLWAMGDAADEVRATEQAFADTMAARDLEAFSAFLAEDTVFHSGAGELRGKAAVVAAWSVFYEGEAAPFSWAPDIVLVRESGQMALSSGPVFGADGQRVATFTSVWERQADGAWKIVFDKGERYCEPDSPDA